MKFQGDDNAACSLCLERGGDDDNTRANTTIYISHNTAENE